MRSRIAGTGGALPERILTNRDLQAMVDTSDEWIVSRTGIRERRIAAEGQTTSDLALEASRHALAAAGLRPGDIDLIIVATSTPDMVFPSTACLLQKKLGIRHGAAFDVQAVCTGFVYALATADQFLRSGMHKRTLVVGAEVFSRILDWKDRGTCVLFGDGAGGRITGDPTLKMDGGAVFKLAVRVLEESAREALEANGMTVADVDWFVAHQANVRIISHTAKKLGIPPEKCVVTVDVHANTSAASIPLALDVAVRDGRIRRGDLVLLEGVGGGFTWGSVLIRW